MSSYRAIMTYTSNFDLFVNAVESIRPMWDNLTIIDNSINKYVFEKYPNAPFDIIEPDCFLTCSQSFNFAQNITRYYNKDILIMMHSDIGVTNENELKRFLNTLENMVKYEKNKNWGTYFTHYDSMAAFNMDCMDVIGEWDQNITHYPIDIDYYYRIKKAEFECLDFGGDWVNHYPSSTVNKNLSMRYINHIHHNDCNWSYYQKKWGGTRDHEIFIFPFNGRNINEQYLNMINNSFYSKLLESSSSTEGGFLFGHDENTRLSQFSLILNILNAIKPKKILETGTHKFMFTYFLSQYLECFEIDTFDTTKECLKSWELVNKEFPNIIVNFHLGDSKETLSEVNKSFDLAWIDASHLYPDCYYDITNAGRLNIPYILVDDYKLYTGVQESVKQFLEENNNYYEIKNPYWQYDQRGILILRRRRN